MDTKIEIKDHLADDVTSQNDIEYFTKDVIIKTNSAVLQDIVVKTEIKSETPSPDFCSPDREFLSEGSLMKFKKYNSDHEMDSQITIKEESWWLERETLSAYDEVKNGELTSGKSPRLCTEAVSGDNCGFTLLPSVEASGKITSFTYGKDCPECESQENVTNLPPACLQQSGNCTDGGKIYSRDLLIDKDDRSNKHNICDNSFTDSSSLKRRNLIHKGMEPAKCKICEKRFTRVSSLKQHNLIHEGKKPYKCEICEKHFTHLKSLKLHNLVHEGKKPHKCEICEKCFTHSSSLKYHNFMHEGEKPHKCKVCNKGFIQLSDLKLHFLVHEGKKPYKCKICNKSFTRLSSLKRHNLTHEGKRLHKCETCEKSFILLSHLKSHNLIHEGVKPYKCDICGRSFYIIYDLKRHTLIHQRKKVSQL